MTHSQLKQEDRIQGDLRADSKLTREGIMHAAVELFAENGYSRTSMRAIASKANVNVAAANYHFGSKRNLFETAFHQCVAPINEERLKRLDALQQQIDSPGVEQILRAFLVPDLADSSNPTWSKLAARIFVEPRDLSKPLLESVFGPIAERFVGALTAALPNVSQSEIEWRFHFVVGAMLQLVRADAPLQFRTSQATELPAAQQIDALCNFVVGGLCQNSPRSPEHAA